MEMLEKIKSSWFGILCLLVTTTLSAVSTPSIAAPTSTDPMQQYIADTSTHTAIPARDLAAYLQRARISNNILYKMSRPFESRPWDYYRSRVLTDEKIKAGVKFWRKHAKDLARAEEQFGVPANIIVAILGIETLYGKHQGDFRVVDTLSTLAFAYPERSAYFKRELTEFFLLSREQRLDPMRIYGSYAGAIGYPQFMPSSYRQYAVNFSGSNKVDLQRNPVDAIGSIANYLKLKGWHSGQPVATKAEVTGKKYFALLNHSSPKKFQPRYTLRQLKSYGVKPVSDPNEASKANKALLVGLETTQGHEWWVGYPNFSVITAYNASAKYAMAVYELGQAVEEAYTKYRYKHAHDNWFKRTFASFD